MVGAKPNNSKQVSSDCRKSKIKRNHRTGGKMCEVSVKHCREETFTVKKEKFSVKKERNACDCTVNFLFFAVNFPLFLRISLFCSFDHRLIHFLCRLAVCWGLLN